MYGRSNLAAHIQSNLIDSNGKKAYNKFIYIRCRGGYSMEYVKILCCGKDNSELGTLSLLLDRMTSVLGITIKNMNGVCFADFAQEEVDEENVEYHEPFEVRCEFVYQSKECRMDAERITNAGKRYIYINIQYREEDDISLLASSIWYEFKEKLIGLLHGNYEQIFWLADSQNMKMATDLYGRLHMLENYLREIINSYMTIKHGGDWFEKYSYEEYMNKYLKFSEWFRGYRYDLFKKVDNHLYNLEIDDIFVALKAAKKKQITNVVKRALEDIKKHEKDKATEIASVELLDSPSLWDEEGFDEIFSKSVVGRWKDDLSKRRNMVAHNKMICRDMYNDTVSAIDYFEKEFRKADELLKKKIKSEETLEVIRLRSEAEEAMNLEYCDITSELLEEQDIIERLNETDDFICLSGIINDSISDISEKIEDTLLSLKYVREGLQEETFFEDDELVRKDLLEKYIELGDSHYLYSTWKTLLEGKVTKEIYFLIEDILQEHLLSMEQKLENIRDSVFCVDLNCFSEGDIVRIKDFEGNEFAVNVSGWFCPERGSSNEVYVNWIENGVNSVYGGIYISYGDYEMTEDGIPIPCVEDELIVKFSEVNNRLEAVIDSIAEVLNKIESQYIELEI